MVRVEIEESEKLAVTEDWTHAGPQARTANVLTTELQAPVIASSFQIQKPLSSSHVSDWFGTTQNDVTAQ